MPRFSLRRAIVVTLLSGALLSFNLRPRIENVELLSKPPLTLDTPAFRSFGWPVVVYREPVLPHDTTYFVPSASERTLCALPDPEFSPTALLANLAVAAAIIIAALYAGRTTNNTRSNAE